VGRGGGTGIGRKTSELCELSAKNFLKVQTAPVNLNVVPNIPLRQHKATSVLRHGLTFALRLSYSPANLVLLQKNYCKSRGWGVWGGGRNMVMNRE